VVTDFLAVETSRTKHAAGPIIAGAEAGSEHFLGRRSPPGARARRQGAGGRSSDFNAIPGRGVRPSAGKTDPDRQRRTARGSRHRLSARSRAGGSLAEQGKTPVFVAVDGRCARCWPSPTSRAQGAREAIALLHRLGIETVMATGDLAAVAQHIARQVGIERVVARATPADKLELIRELQQPRANASA
jgi:Cu+-exporting ATPase